MLNTERKERKVLCDLRSTVMVGQLAIGAAVVGTAMMASLLIMYGHRFGALLFLPVLVVVPLMALAASTLHKQGRRAEKELKYLS